MSEHEYYRLDLVLSTRGSEQTRSELKATEKFIEQTRKRGELLNRMKISPAVQMIDRISAPLRKIEGNLGRLANTTKKVTIEAVDKTTSVVKKITGALTSPLGLIGIGAAGYGIGATILTAMRFEERMSSIEALTGLTKREMMDIQALAIEMGEKTKFSALEAAMGMEELLKAGVTPAQVQAGALEAALNLATAGELELARAAEIMSTSLNAYRSDGLTAAQAADILAGTANISASSVEELSNSLSQVSAVASGVGMSFKDTNIALGLFANSTLKGSDAGTSLKTFLSNLIPVTDKQIELFDQLGLTTGGLGNKFYTAEGKLKSFDEIAEIMQNTFKDMTDMQRQAYMETIFGSDAIRAGLIIYQEGAAGVRKFNDEMSRVTALDVARKKMNNAAGAVEQFKGAMETLQISALLPMMPTLKRIAEGAANLSERVSPSIISAMEGAAKKVEGFFDRLEADEKFQQLGWGEKIIYAVTEITNALNEWMDGDGGQKVRGFGEAIGKLIAIGLQGAIPLILPSIELLGKTIGSALLTGFGAALKSNPVAAAIMGAIPGAAAGAGVGAVFGGVGAVPGALIGAGAGAASGLNAWYVNKITEDTVIGNNAAGTSYWRGGPTWVGERGPELLNLPRGSQVIPSDGLRLSAAVTGAPNINLNFDLSGLIGQIVVNGKESLNQSADEIAAIIASKLKTIFEVLA